MAAAATRAASTLARPSRLATTEGRPKTPLPMMEFTTSATRLQRPMARRRVWPGSLVAAEAIRAFVSHADTDWQEPCPGHPRFALALTGAGAVPAWFHLAFK